MSQAQSLKKKQSANTSAQPLQRSGTKNNTEALDTKADSAAVQDEAPLQKKAYRTALSSSPSAAQDEPRLQTKLSVSTPGDSHEQEADRVADEVVSRSAAAQSSEENKLNPGSTKPENTASSPQSLQTKISRMVEPAPAATEIPEPDMEATAPAETATDNEQGVSAEVEQQIAGLRGQGAQLPEQVRAEMESQFNHDFSSVSIHTGGTADALCKQLSARAFTVGSDIFFAAGEYAPDSQEGKRLLAHELTHVVQQGRGVTRKIMRVATENPAGSGNYEDTVGGISYKFHSTDNPKKLAIGNVEVPAFKFNRPPGGVYAGPLYVRRGARSTVQRENWINYFDSPGKITNWRNLQGLPDTGTAYFQSTLNSSFYLFGTKQEIQNKCYRPFWGKNHNPYTLEIDHKLEDQLGGSANGGGQLPKVDNPDLSNYELLERGDNGASGRNLDANINKRIDSAITIFDVQGITNSARRIRREYIVEFTQTIEESSPQSPYPNGGTQYWASSEIIAGDHLEGFNEIVGTPTTPGIPAPGTAVKIFLAPNGGTPVDAPTSAAGPFNDLWNRVRPTGPISYLANGDRATIPVEAFRAGTDRSAPGVTADYRNITLFFDRIPVTMPSLTGSLYRINKEDSTGSALQGAYRSLSIPGLSPINIDNLDLDGATGFVGSGKLLPSVPIFEGADIDVIVQGTELRLQKTFELDEIKVPSPFRVDAASVTLFVSTTNGLGVQGDISVSIQRIGRCNITAELSTANGLLIAGRFNFDQGLFNGIDANVRAEFHRQNIFDENDHGHWGVSGDVIVPRGKIRGIERANVNMSYTDQEGFKAHGEATLNVPGVESGTIDVTHSEESGVEIGGRFNLRQGNGIRSGFINASVVEKPDGTGYQVTANGEAEPDIPGINSKLIINYNDGAFTAEANADYSRGMLSGRVNAGVTNRTVNDDGTLSEAAAPENPLVVYGGGQLTLQIAPWLQGTAGVQFAPNGEITVTGEIGLPSQLEIFARKEINKSIFNIAVQAPIFPGIVAEVGGGLSATAGIGPGVIDQLRLGITYNPAHEDQTRITGDAHLNIPANAGLRLSVRAGIGLGITGASATGGLDIGGTLGIEGAAEAGVHVEWTPTTGLDIRAQLAVYAQPSFTFDIGGYVSVRALGFSVYDNRWQFASYTFGSDYRFGIRLPIHYREGEPFDISLDDVQFEVPNIDTNQLLRGLIARIA